MERNGRRMLAIVCLVITAAALLGSGCAKKSISADGWPVRYQDVQIPGYQPQDYLNLLDADHEATRCNAICNLIPHAREYGTLLSVPRPDASEKPKEPVDEAALQTARRVYEKVKAQIGGSSKACQAAALVFMAEFATTYSEEQEIVDLVSSLETKDAHPQYEQLNVLTTIQERPHLVDPDLLKPFLESPDWVVRAMTCRLLAQMPCDALHSRLIQAYGRSALESDSILVIHAFGQGYDGEVFDLLRGEIQENHNQRLKAEWAGILPAHRDQAVTRQWLFSEENTIDDQTVKSVLDAYFEQLNNPEGQRFFQEMILSKQTRWLDVLAPERFYEGIYRVLAYGEKTEALTDLQAAVMGNEPLKEKWLAYRAQSDLEAGEQAARNKREDHFTKSVLPKYNLLLEAFLKDTEKLFLAEGMDAQETAVATRDIRQMLEILKEEESR